MPIELIGVIRSLLLGLEEIEELNDTSSVNIDDILPVILRHLCDPRVLEEFKVIHEIRR